MFRLSINPEHLENPWWTLGGDALWRRLATPRQDRSSGAPAKPAEPAPVVTLNGEQLTAFLKAAKRIEGWYTSSDIDDTPIAIERVEST